MIIDKIKKPKKVKSIKSYIDKYKLLKDNKLILWNVKGKRIDKGLTRYQKRKISAAFREYTELGPRTKIIYPNKKKGESNYAYTRRLNKIKRENGLGVSDISGIALDANLAKDAHFRKNKIIIKTENNTLKSEGFFVPVDPFKFVEYEDEESEDEGCSNYLYVIIDDAISNFKLKPTDTVYPMHSRFKGAGQFIVEYDELIERLCNWAMQYAKNTQKMDSFLTGLFFEKITDK
jgi:hypothetical protein